MTREPSGDEGAKKELSEDVCAVEKASKSNAGAQMSQADSSSIQDGHCLPAPSDALARLGFRGDEQAACRTMRDSRLMIPAVVAGSPARLLLESIGPRETYLYLQYVRSRGLICEAEDERWGITRGIEVQALGRRTTYEAAPVRLTNYNSDLTPPLAGGISLGFGGNALLGIDTATPAVARSERGDLRARLPAPAFRLVLAETQPNEALLTDSVRFDIAPGSSALVINPGWAESALSLAFVDAHVSPRRAARYRRIAKARGWAVARLTLPNSITVSQRIRIVEATRLAWSKTLRPGGCDGVLGMDVLRRWVTVFDLGARHLLAYAY